MAKRKKNARIICRDGKEFWTTQKQFWRWIREGIVNFESNNPLTGRFRGKYDNLLVMIRHVVLSVAAPNHKDEVIDSYSKIKRRRICRAKSD